MSEQVLTDEQQAIVDYVRQPKGDLLIEATAGSGKTFALLKSLEVIPQRSILVCAYNKKIAEELTARAPKPRAGSAMHVKTFHAIGKSIISKHFPTLKFDRNGTEDIISRALDGRAFGYQQRRAAVRLLRQYKEGDEPGNVIANQPEIEQVGRDYDLFGKLSGNQIDQVVEVVARGYELSYSPNELTVMDFCDMIWLPLALNLAPPSRYQAIIVDEWQDISAPQMELIWRLRAPGTGRMIMAGDGKQAINAWRGAVASIVRDRMTVEHKAKVLTLTTSFRCSKAVIKAARALVPEIKAWEGALEGSETRVALNALPRMILQRYSDTPHTFILSRNNSALLDAALFLWREGVRFQLNAGQEMLGPLFDLLDVLDLRTPDLFRKSLIKWHEEKSAQADAAGSMELQERYDEQRSMLMSAANYTAPSGLRKLLQSILEPGKTGVMMSTVHKVKGLEADRVFLLRQTFKRHQISPQQAARGTRVNVGDLVEDQLYKTISFGGTTEEDLNIEYVAITRAKEHLIWVDIGKKEDREVEDAPEPLSEKLLKSLTIEQLEDEYIKAEGELARTDSLGNSKDATMWAEHANLVLAEIKRRAP